MTRLLFSVLLAFVVASTSQAMAVARGASAATGTMVLCTGAGLVTVHLDTQGNPTEASHICPDAVLAFALIAPGMSVVAPHPTVFAVLGRADPVLPLRADKVHKPPSTGPPSVS